MTAATLVAEVSDSSGVAAARRIATQSAKSIGFNETAAGKVALAATELSTNLLKHAGSGSLLVFPDEDDETLSVISIDKGPGIANVNIAMSDGFSTAGSSGSGLGALRRAAASFEIYSLPGKGTAVLCRIDSEKPEQRGEKRALAVSGICVPIPGEEEPGDSWTFVREGDELLLMVADGLGHGPAAATAGVGATRALREGPGRSPADSIHAAHAALKSTRGAAVGVARIDPSRDNLTFAGVGNISGTIDGEAGSKKTISHNGIVGVEMRKVQDFTYPWGDSSILVLHSDGIGTSWRFDQYPGLQSRDPALIASVLHRDYCRGKDDSTVVVVKKK